MAVAFAGMPAGDGRRSVRRQLPADIQDAVAGLLGVFQMVAQVCDRLSIFAHCFNK